MYQGIRLALVMTLTLISYHFSFAANVLNRLESYYLPAKEISGIAWRINPATNNKELVVVGDRDHTIYFIDWNKRHKKFSYTEVSIAEMLRQSGVHRQSQWESVYCDQSGRIFIIQEDTSLVLVISADLKSLETTIGLNMDTGADQNSGAEGLNPLRNGHFLVVKEKDPLALIEFTESGLDSNGYKKSLSLRNGGHFRLPASLPASFREAHRWTLPAQQAQALLDVSELNTDGDGSLYLLSDESNAIAKISDPDKSTGAINIEKLWKLPEDIVQAEGMVFDDNHQPVIAVDSKKKNQPNIFVFSKVK